MRVLSQQNGLNVYLCIILVFYHLNLGSIDMLIKKERKKYKEIFARLTTVETWKLLLHTIEMFSKMVQNPQTNICITCSEVV
jgi:hypothetical protein